MFSDSPKEECGVLGLVTTDGGAARSAFFGLYALQHRGQESAGIAVCDGTTVRMHKDVGLVSQVFDEASMEPLQGDMAIGHTRYSTTGSNNRRNAQPFLIETRLGPLAVAHNGNLINSSALRDELLEDGIGLSSSSDTEVITMMLGRTKGADWIERINSCMIRWKGAYSLTLLTREGVFAVRDPWGFRPLSWGVLPGGGWAVASETSALQTLGCHEFHEVEPGKVVHFKPGCEPAVHQVIGARVSARCTFEHVYFSRPDSVWDGVSVHHVRQRLGEELFREAATEADVVVPVPDSSVPAAIGYARVSGIPYNDGLIKNRYIGRTFIQPTDALRKQGVALKFNPLRDNLAGQRIILIDDSIVRGTTAGPLVRLIREAGAMEVHMRITCPPIRHPCYMGVDMGTYNELIAHKLTVEEIGAKIGVDSLAFLSLDGMMRAIGKGTTGADGRVEGHGYCNACFTGKYPIEIPTDVGKSNFEEAIA